MEKTLYKPFITAFLRKSWRSCGIRKHNCVPGLKCLGKVKFCKTFRFSSIVQESLRSLRYCSQWIILLTRRRNLAKNVPITQIIECLITWLRMNFIISVNKSVVFVKCARLTALSQNIAPPPFKVSIYQYDRRGSNANNRKDSLSTCTRN